jgi:hypothetical protein
MASGLIAKLSLLVLILMFTIFAPSRACEEDELELSIVPVIVANTLPPLRRFTINLTNLYVPYNTNRAIAMYPNVEYVLWYSVCVFFHSCFLTNFLILRF